MTKFTLIAVALVVWLMPAPAILAATSSQQSPEITLTVTGEAGAPLQVQGYAGEQFEAWVVVANNASNMSALSFTVEFDAAALNILGAKDGVVVDLPTGWLVQKNVEPQLGKVRLALVGPPTGSDSLTVAVINFELRSTLLQPVELMLTDFLAGDNSAPAIIIPIRPVNGSVSLLPEKSDQPLTTLLPPDLTRASVPTSTDNYYGDTVDLPYPHASETASPSNIATPQPSQELLPVSSLPVEMPNSLDIRNFLVWGLFFMVIATPVVGTSIIWTARRRRRYRVSAEISNWRALDGSERNKN